LVAESPAGESQKISDFLARFWQQAENSS